MHIYCANCKSKLDTDLASIVNNEQYCLNCYIVHLRTKELSTTELREQMIHLIKIVETLKSTLEVWKDDGYEFDYEWYIYIYIVSFTSKLFIFYINNIHGLRL